MSPRRLLVIGKLPPQLRQTLEEKYSLVERADVAGLAHDFPVAVTTSMDGASAQVMDGIPDLRLLACNGAGLESIDVAEAERRGVMVRNTPDAVTQDTAEFAIALIFSLGRRTREADAFVRANRWTAEKMPAGRRLEGRTLGIVGMGKIGKAIAKKATALGLHVRYNARTPKPALPYPFDADVRALAAASDILLLALSVGPDAQKIVSAPVLDALGPGGLLINISRGSAVDEEALIEALRSGTIGGAALDVFPAEPNVNPLLFGFENVVLTPHIAAVTEQTRRAMADQIRSEIDAFFAA